MVEYNLSHHRGANIGHSAPSVEEHEWITLNTTTTADIIDISLEHAQNKTTKSR